MTERDAYMKYKNEKAKDETIASRVLLAVLLIVCLWCVFSSVSFWIVCKGQEIGTYVTLGDYSLQAKEAEIVRNTFFAVSFLGALLSVIAGYKYRCSLNNGFYKPAAGNHRETHAKHS